MECHTYTQVYKRLQHVTILYMHDLDNFRDATGIILLIPIRLYNLRKTFPPAYQI